MILYLAGNFPQLSKIEKEQAMAERIVQLGGEYHRLMTYFYIKDCNTVIQVRRNINES